MKNINTKKKCLNSVFNSFFWLFLLVNFVLISLEFLVNKYTIFDKKTLVGMWNNHNELNVFAYVSFGLAGLMLICFACNLISNIKNKNFKLSWFKLIASVLVIGLVIMFITSKPTFVENSDNAGWIFINNTSGLHYSKLGYIALGITAFAGLSFISLFFAEKKYVYKKLIATEKA